uniref:centrosomal protein of 57 kDa-like isoform X1 n=2 Tax=Myxine glutinosa TaxID=7769 RepID=UPI00358F2C15
MCNHTSLQDFKQVSMSDHVGPEPAVPVERHPAVGGNVGRGSPSPTPLFSAYPAHRPFLNWHPISLRCPPTSAFPESNGTAVCTALLSLWRKIQQLESERNDARKQMSLLTSRLRAYRLTLAKRYTGKETEAASHVVSQTPHNSSNQFSASLLPNFSPSRVRGSVEDRDEQIVFKTGKEHGMREIERAGPRPAWGPVEQGGNRLHSEHSSCKGGLVHVGNKLDRLEKEYLHLSATQCLAQDKMQDLEQKLQQEEKERQVVMETTAMLQTGIENNKMLIHRLLPPSQRTLRSPSHNCVEENAMQPGKDVAGLGKEGIKLTKNGRMESGSKTKVGYQGHLHRGECPFENQNGEQPKEARHQTVDRGPRYHYHLNLKQLPFVVGTSSNPSQSLPGRLHSLLHSLKQHQPRLCCRENDPSTERSLPQQLPALHSGSQSPPSPSTEELDDLLLAVQDAFDHMTLEQRQLKRRMECAPPQRRDELNAELAAITTRLENKTAQLRRVIELTKVHRETRGRGSLLRKEGDQGKGRADFRYSHDQNGGKMDREEAETVRKGKFVTHDRDVTGSRGTSSLRLFRDVKLLQASLAPADVGWS